MDSVVHTTEIIAQSDPRCANDAFSIAKKKEIQGLEERGVWEKMSKALQPKNANVLGGRFVLTLKKAGTKDETLKARFVAQGFSDREKDIAIHNVTSLRQSSVRIIASFAASLGHGVFSHDVTQAYTQSDDCLSRELFLQPKPRDAALFSLSEGETLKLLKPIYGKTDAGDYWNVTVDWHAGNNLRIKTTTGDSSLYIKPRQGREAEGLMGMLFDDGLLCGNTEFQRLTEATLEKFDSRQREWDNVEFYGLKIKTIPGAGILIDQPDHIKRINLLPDDANFEAFRSSRSALAWITHTRLDVACYINKAAKVTLFDQQKVKEFNSCIKYVKRNQFPLRFRPLNTNTLQIRVYADAAFRTKLGL